MGISNASSKVKTSVSTTKCSERAGPEPGLSASEAGAEAGSARRVAPPPRRPRYLAAARPSRRLSESITTAKSCSRASRLPLTNSVGVDSTPALRPSATWRAS